MRRKEGRRRRIWILIWQVRFDLFGGGGFEIVSPFYSLETRLIFLAIVLITTNRSLARFEPYTFTCFFKQPSNIIRNFYNSSQLIVVTRPTDHFYNLCNTRSRFRPDLTFSKRERVQVQSSQKYSRCCGKRDISTLSPNVISNSNAISGVFYRKRRKEESFQPRRPLKKKL